MDLDTDDEVLRNLADGKSMDYGLWPGILSRLIPRLEKIVQNGFPLKIPISSNQSSSQAIPSSPPVKPESSQNSISSTQSTNKENAPPTVTDTPSGILPPEIQNLLSSVVSTLETHFTKYPPHTIQRLSELILFPRQHYRTLPSYLHAVDRVVHVTSGAHTFPLPPAIPEPSSANVLSNGTSDPLSISWGNPATASSTQSNLGSDESLGGALLTPIPWLNKINIDRGNTHSPLEGEVKTESTEMIDGPNGLGGIETVTVSVNGISSTRSPPAALASSESNGLAAELRLEGGVTQGELLRQEQRAGVVPAAQLTSHRADTDGLGEEDEIPHARGPEEIGMEDMGPQSGPTGSERGGPSMSMQGINVEAAVGRKAEVTDEEEEKSKDEKVEAEAPGTPKREAEEEIGSDEKRLKSEPEASPKDGDIKFADVDGKIGDEKEVGEDGENKGADAVDTTTV